MEKTKLTREELDSLSGGTFDEHKKFMKSMERKYPGSPDLRKVRAQMTPEELAYDSYCLHHRPEDGPLKPFEG